MIGLALTGLLLSFLFSSITRVANIETRLNTARSTLLARQHLQTRLQDLFLGLSSSPLYTCRFPHEKHDSLIVTFQHGIDPDPAFSGKVLGKIYLDDAQNLSLAIWPEKGETLWRKEILLPQIESVHFEFLGPQNGAFVWQNHWPKERKEYPVAIRLNTGKKTPLQFAFLLPSNQIATYGGRT